MHANSLPCQPSRAVAVIVLVESLTPIFLLILLGAALKQASFISEDGWWGMERLSYYLFFPALLFQTLYQADFSRIAEGKSAAGFLVGIAVLMALMLALRPVFQSVLSLTPASYSSLFQAATRWNAFVVLAIVERIAGPDMLAIVAIGIGAMVVPINIVNIGVVAALGDTDGPRPGWVHQLVRNPLILSVLFGLMLRATNVSLPTTAETVVELLARISLPLGLILVGVGLRLRMPGKAMATVATGTALKLFLMPLMLAGAAWLFGVRGEELAIVALCGAGPSAMNGYVVARELGGDAPLLASTVTVQTAMAFFTIPIVLTLARMPGLG